MAMSNPMRPARRHAPTMRRVFALAAASLAAALPCGCAAPGGAALRERSTRPTASDLIGASTEVLAQMRESEWFKARGPDSPPVLLVPEEMENISNERLGRIDRWAAVARLVFAPEMLDLLKQKNIEVLLPRDEMLLLTRAGAAPPLAAELEPGEAPTHLLTGQIRSITRTASQSGGPADQRQDLISTQFAIVEFSSRRIEWTGTWEFKRAARGVLAD